MLAAFDIGNTNIVLGVFDGERIAASFRLSTRHSATGDEYACLVDGLLRLSGLALSVMDAACIASVVPPLTDVFVGLSRDRLGIDPVVVGPKTVTGITVAYHPPSDVGADRIVNAVAARHRWPTDLVIVDFGTATTFDAVTAKGEYLGGVIVPGVMVSLDALFLRTAKLPKVDMARPASVVGRSTVHSIQSGAYYGYLSMVEGLARRIKAELTPPIRTIATGGLAPHICSECPEIDEVDQDLTLKGLRLIWEWNRGTDHNDS